MMGYMIDMNWYMRQDGIGTCLRHPEIEGMNNFLSRRFSSTLVEDKRMP